MTTLQFHQLDVFTGTPLEGNPLAVFPEADGLSGKVMQALAREMNLSETAFVLGSDSATRKVRFFTPTSEIPLAGHPTIGTWWLLAEIGVLDLPPEGSSRITQETGAGVLPVDIALAKGQPVHVTMTQPLPDFGIYVDDGEKLGAALGGDRATVGQPVPQVVATALPQLIVPITSLDALEHLPSGGTGGELASLLRSFGTDCVMCYVTESIESGSTVRCRMFAPGLGVPEDPATGSAAGALASYLVWHDVVMPHDGHAAITVEQGIEIGRPSRIETEITVGNGGEITGVSVGGKAVTIIVGEVTL